MDEQRDGLIIGTWIGEENEGKNKESKKESERSGSTLSYRSAPTVCLSFNLIKSISKKFELELTFYYFIILALE